MGFFAAVRGSAAAFAVVVGVAAVWSGAAFAGAPAGGVAAAPAAAAAAVEGVKIYLVNDLAAVGGVFAFRLGFLPERPAGSPDDAPFWDDIEDYVAGPDDIVLGSRNEGVAKVSGFSEDGYVMVTAVSAGETYITVSIKSKTTGKEFSDSALVKVISRDDYIAAHKALLENNIGRWVRQWGDVDEITSERFPDSATIADGVYSAAWWTADSGFWADKVVTEDETYIAPVDGSDDEPGSGTNGSYSFKLAVTSDGDEDWGIAPYTFTTRLLTIQIRAKGGAVSVVAAKRELPASAPVSAALVKPVAKASASFAVGPNPVSKGGALSFFSGSAVTGGSLNIFDAGGKLVASVPVGSAGSAGGKIASWTASAPAGAYVAKGALVNAKTGKREKVSVLFGVAK